MRARWSRESFSPECASEYVQGRPFRREPGFLTEQAMGGNHSLRHGLIKPQTLGFQPRRPRISGSVTSLPCQRASSASSPALSCSLPVRRTNWLYRTEDRADSIGWKTDAATSLHQWTTELSSWAGLPQERGQPGTKAAWEGGDRVSAGRERVEVTPEVGLLPTRYFRLSYKVGGS